MRRNNWRIQRESATLVLETRAWPPCLRKAIRHLGLTQQEAAKRMGLTQPKVSGLLRGDLSNLSERKLMDCLTRLGYDIEISVRPAKAKVGHLVLAA